MELRVEAGLLTFAGLLIGAAVAGAILTVPAWLFFRRRRIHRASELPVDDLDPLYLVFSRLSHRLKTSGEVVRGQLHGFTEELPTDAERWHVARRAIFEEATQISAIVERLDLVVRLGMTGQPLVMEPVNVARLIEDLMLGLGPAADARGVLLGGVVGDSARDAPYVSGDAAGLREVFSNILENALVHGREGTEVKAEVAARNGRVVVRISDTGKGIKPEILRELFEAGRRNYRPQNSRGTGMGLYLSKLLVEMHGGTVVANSGPTDGTTFEISLPARRADVTTADGR